LRVLSGIQPSGKLHIGNYFGAMRQHLQLQAENESCDMPEVLEIAWILSCLTPMGLLQRCTSFKDKVAQGLSPNHGLFAYPVLQAADILIFNSELVPVGADQKQHIEVTRDIALRFNNRYGEILTVPKELILESVAVVPGIDGRKMSKSYDNTIEIFEPEKSVKKKVMRIVTDSTPVEEPKDPEKCNVFALLKLLASPDEVKEWEGKYRCGGTGYGTVKKRLVELLIEYFRPYRQKRAELENDIGFVEKVLADGAERAGAVARQTLKKVRQAVGLGG